VTAAGDLAGFTVAVTADRRRDEQALLLERLGLAVSLYPLLRTDDHDLATARAVTQSLVEEPPDYLVANTGYGMRAWLELAESWGLKAPLVSSLRRGTLIAARGAKAVGELRRAGLDAWYRAPNETLQEIIERLSREDLNARTVAVQLHGEDSDSLLDALGDSGAVVRSVPVYRMAPAGQGAGEALVPGIVAGAFDAVTFTAAPQLEAMMAAAAKAGLTVPLLASFNEGGVVAACIGHVCAAAAASAGIGQPLVPEHPRLGSLARAVGKRLASYQLVLEGDHGPVTLSGGLVEVNGEPRELPPAERRALRAVVGRALGLAGDVTGPGPRPRSEPAGPGDEAGHHGGESLRPASQDNAELTRLEHLLDGALAWDQSGPYLRRASMLRPSP